MVNLNKTDLFYVLFDALRQHTDDLYFIDGDNPYRFSFNDEVLCVFIANVHSASRSDSDEFRIQCPGNLPVTMRGGQANGENILVLGYSADTNAFSAWDPQRIVARNPRTQRFSIYTRLSRMRDTRAQGFTGYRDSDGQVVVMFQAEFIGLYAENSAALHLATIAQLRRVASRYRRYQAGSLRRAIRLNRRKIEITRRAYPRSPLFRQGVLDAYDHQCAICGIQLDLVEAAHIVPHSHPQGIDDVSNGLALCSLHHRSYDLGLVYVTEDYSIHLNSDRLHHLRQMGRVSGLRKYRRMHRDELILPSADNLLPAPDNLVMGNRIRGIR